MLVVGGLLARRIRRALSGNLEVVYGPMISSIACYNFTIGTNAHSRARGRRKVTRFMRRLVFGNARGQGT